MADFLPIEKVRELRLYKELTATERAFFEAYAANGGDPCLAIKQAQGVEDEKAQRMMSAARMKNPRISRLIDKMYGNEDGLPSRKEFLTHLWKLILRPGEKTEAAKLIQLYSDVMGWRRGTERPVHSDFPDDPIPDSLVGLLEEKKDNDA
jgi:hypothetical protein